VRFLVDASLPRAIAELLQRYGHQPIDVRDIGLRLAADSAIAEHARLQQLALITADFDFADIRLYPPAQYFGIVVIDRPDDATVAQVLAMVERFSLQRELLLHLVGRLVIVDAWRIRVRPALPTPPPSSGA
jgi:predicted nuclease of predicted toxin-antitoxin system